MIFLTKPLVSLISRPQFVEPTHMPVNWMGEASDGERLAEYAGRVCYMSHTNPAEKTTERYLTHILNQRHGSVLEHANYSLLIEGISRSCSHELVRHRAGFAYSQLSQRYVDEKDCAFVVPPAILDADEHTRSTWELSMEAAQQEYEILVGRLMHRYDYIADKTHRRKVAREAARSVLPNATETKLVVTANLRAWRTMLEQRLGEGAEREIRRLAWLCLGLLRNEAPSIFADFQLYSTEDGTQAAKVEHSKV